MKSHMFLENINFLKKTTKQIILFSLVGLVLFCMLLPVTHYKLGNIFFGEVPTLYNVRLAQYFFQYASNPLLGMAEPWAHYQLSRTYFIQGEMDKSLAEAYRELEVYPDNMRTYYILGLTLGYMDREEEAIEAFGKFIEWKPESWAARNDRAWLQFRIGDFEGALKTLEPVASSTGNPWVQNTYGTLLMNQGRYTEAKKAFEHAQVFAGHMTEEGWGRAYPGNDPRVYASGLEGMRGSIDKNLKILEILGY